MNQILASKKIYVTPKLKRKKKIYKFQFIVSIIVVIVLSGWFAHSEYTIFKANAETERLREGFSFDTTIVEEESLVVALEDNSGNASQVVTVDEQVATNNQQVYTTSKGTEYTIDAVLNIPSLGINYPVISETSDELLKISLNKFWGGNPNTVGNYCIVGHNYDGKDILFGKLNRIKNGDIVELQDSTGKTLQYKVYNIFIVKPTDVACTSQLTNGQTEMTLITCAEGGKTRLIVKCRAIES